MKNIFKITITFLISLFFTIPILAAPYVNLKLSYDGKIHNYNKEAVYLYVNGKNIENLPMQPIIFNDYTLVPAREVFENLGAEVLWHKENSEIEILYEGNNIKMQLNEQKATVNGVEYLMPIVPKLINAKTMIPTRFVAEAIGLNVNWDGKKRIINITNQIISEPNIETTSQNIQNSQQTTQQNTQNNFGNINFIEMPNSDENSFYILADNKIKDFKINKLDENKYYIDIFNFKTSIKEEAFDSYSKYVSKILIEQKDEFLRIIFNLIEPTSIFETSLEPDGKTLVINIGGNYIKKIEKLQKNENDILKIYSDNKIDYKIQKLENENKINLKIKNGNPEFLIQNFKETKYIENIMYSRETEEFFNIEIICKSIPNIKETNEENILTLEIGESIENSTPENQNLMGNEFIINKNSIVNTNIKNIIHKDEYLKKEYTLKFENDITGLIKEGDYKINNNLIKNIKVENIDGKTEIKFICNKIIAINIWEDSSNIYIKPVLPKEKYKNIVVIDPGHGGSDPGTDGFGLYEKNLVLDISNRLINLIEKEGIIKVYSSRTTDVYPSFDDRTSLGNEVGDMFVSIHINAPGTASNTKPNGTEIHYLNLNTASSGLNSKTMAEVFLKNIIDSIGTTNRGLKTSNFKVLRDSKIPAVLCEIAFVTNPSDNEKLKSEKYRQKIAEALYKSIKNLFEKYPSKR